MNNIEEIKARIDIVDLVSETVKLRRAGKNYTGFCPFHANTRTPAFVVFPDSGTWRCFGECNEGGDIFKFVMRKEGWDFPEALHYLAEKAGITPEPVTPKKKEEDEYIEKLRSILEEAVIFFRYHLTQTENGKQTLSYLKQNRRLNDKTIETFELGYAPHAWEVMLDHFHDKGISDKELLDCGLITKRNEADGYHDRFRNRVIFPIRDASQRICGFGARALSSNDIPKYLNSPQTLIFDKSALLFGLDKARKPIRTADQVVIVEGYFDVIGLYQAGFQNVVSPMGTALTPVQMRHIKRYTRRIILALDPDSAGEKATLKGLEVARETMDHSEEFVFDPRGLVRSEARLDADIRVCSLPDGLDPDEIALQDADRWQTIVENAKPIITHVIDTLTAGKNLEDPKIKSEIAEKVIPLIRDIPNAVERDTYRQQLARVLHVSEQSLFSVSEVQYLNKRHPRRRKTAMEPDSLETQVKAERNKFYNLEKHIILLLVKKPDMVYDLDRYLKKNDLPPISNEDMEFGDLQLVLSLILDSLKQIEIDAQEYIGANLPGDMAWLKADSEEFILKPESITQNHIFTDLVQTFLNLRKNKVVEKINSLSMLHNSSETEPTNLDISMIQKELLESIKMRATLDRVLSSPLISD